MPPSRRSPLRSLLLPSVVLPLAVAACTSPGDPIVGGGSQPRLDLFVRVLDAGDTVPTLAYAPGTVGQPARLAPAGGLIVAGGQLWPGEVNGRMRRVTDGRIVVNGAGLDGRIPPGQRSVTFGGELGAPRADGVVTVTFPRIEGIAPVTLRMPTIARAEGVAVALAGDELRLRVVPPPAPVAAPFYNPQWSVDLTRGDRSTRVMGTTPLARELVLPVGSLVPGTGAVAATLSYLLAATDALGRPTPSDTAYAYHVQVHASLRFAPVAP